MTLRFFSQSQHAAPALLFALSSSLLCPLQAQVTEQSTTQSTLPLAAPPTTPATAQPALPPVTYRNLWQKFAASRALDWNHETIRMVAELPKYEGGTVVSEIGVLSWNTATDKMEVVSVPKIAVTGDAKVMTGDAVISPDGTRFAIPLNTYTPPSQLQHDGVAIYETKTGQRLHLLPDKGVIGKMAWSPDGSTLAINRLDQTIRLWDAKTGTKRLALATEGQSIAWSLDGTLLAIGSQQKKVRLYDVDSGQKQSEWQIEGNVFDVYRIAFAPDGKTLALSATEWNSSEQAIYSVRLLDAQTGQEQRKFISAHVPIRLRWTPDGSGIAVLTIPPIGRSGKLTLDGEPLAGEVPYKGQLRVWDAATGAERMALDDPSMTDPSAKPLTTLVRGTTPRPIIAAKFRDFAFAPDGKHIVTYNGEYLRVGDLK